MAFHQISIMDVWDIIRRWHNRHSISQIAQALGCDRKTVRGYKRLAESVGLSLDQPLPAKEEVLRLLQNVDHQIGRSAQAQAILLPYLDEISALINDSDLALKPKTAFRVICERHHLTGKVSYPSYKRFIRTHRLRIDPTRVSCRLEVEAGSEVQIDYARMCVMVDPASERRRTLYAFIATLAHSRMKYIELTFSQNQTSFVNSHVRMFEFFGGVPQRILIDNLKAGVIKPDLYDPTFNRSYREMAEHYHCFIDPARVSSPKDKGKVERDVQTVREAVRMQIVLNPTVTLAELNQTMKHWILDEYGQRAHGTTREKPLAAFTERERPALRPLPAERFEISVWKQATVHPDHYVQFQGKAFSVPTAYVTKKVWIRATEHLLQVFHQQQLIAQHVITRRYRHTDQSHFPDNVRAVLDTSGVHQNLLERSARLGPEFHQLIRELLEIHAFLNLRRAQGLVATAEEADDHDLVNDAARLMRQHRLRATPRDLRYLLEKLRVEKEQRHCSPPLFEASREFVRDITYFINTYEEHS